MNFAQWLKSLPGSPTPTSAARKSGLIDATLIRHAAKGSSTADNVIKISRAYGVSPIDALVELGFLKSDDVEGSRVSLRRALDEASVAELLEYLVRAVNRSGMFDGEYSADDLISGGNVINFPTSSDNHDDDEWEPELYVAKRKKPEPGEGDDDYGDGA
ncbi:hypothetical protein [Corynebacterium glutamicum]|uniref:hypothetical protein n=1 Tax=Corynebacterium glutamicum TaxID=1718 RepID=UPI000944B1E8|nr:hypothetical protein [Corynebacterium glutamicum]OKX85153.1 hypothetical protein AUO95_01055 [Corynebacterium glutamicum]